MVILDDLDTPVLGHYIKIWADKWGATGEYKGGTVALKHEKFIVTSNFSIDDLFYDEKKASETIVLIKAIKRRFKVHHFDVWEPNGAGVHRSEAEGSDTDLLPKGFRDRGVSGRCRTSALPP